MSDTTLQWQKRARELHAEGMGCNEIAKELGLSPSTVSRWAKAEGLSFDRSKTAAAVEARVVDLADSRTRLVEKMLNVAHDLLDSANEPYLVFNFGGKENEYNEHLLDRPPVEAVRNMVTTAGIAFDKATRVLEKEKPADSAVASVMDALAAGFARAAEDFDDKFNDSPGAE